MSASATAAAALALHAQGGYPIPLCRPVAGQSRGCRHHGPACPKPGKLPLVRWRRYQTEQPAEADVRAWWHAWPDANVGMPTGQAVGVVVLDVDGDAARAALTKHGTLPPTRSVRTGRPGGQHLHFAAPEQPVPTATALLPGVDIRGEGGLVVLPPSVHWSGGTYAWQEESLAYGLAPLPGWLLALLAEPTNGHGRAERLDVAAILDGVPEGRRDAALFRLACRLRAADVPEPAAAALVLNAAARCEPPFPPDEGLKCVRSAYTRYAPASSSSSSLYVSDDDEFLPAACTLATLRQRFSGATRWLVEGYIARGELTMVPGPPESLKSWALADLARATFGGGQWLGHFAVPQGAVLFIEQERANTLVYQVGRLEQAHGCDLSDLLVVPPGPFLLTDPASQRGLVRLVQAHRPLLVVVNSFRAVFGGRPADSADIRRALGWLGHLAEAADVAIVVVDSLNKAGGLGLLRGMAAHADSLQKAYESDCVLHIERARDAVGRGTGPARVYVGKRRAGAAGPPFAFDLVERGGGVAVVWQGETTVEASAPPNADQQVLAALQRGGQPQTPQTLAQATGLCAGTVRNALTRLKQADQVVQAGRGQWRNSSSSLTYRDDDDDDFRANGHGALRLLDAP